MSNGFNPYGIAGVQQNLLENLLGSEQATRLGKFATGEQMGEMSEEFQRDVISNQKKIDALLNREKGKNVGGLFKFLSTLGGPITSGLVSGGVDMLDMYEQQKHARKQIELAKKLGLDTKWLSTFLGGQARDIASKTETMLDKMKRETNLSGMDFLTKGITSGITGYATGKIGEGIKKAFATPDAFGPLPEGEVRVADGLKGLDLLKPPTADMVDSGFFEKLIKGLKSEDPSRLLEEGGEGQNILQNLLLLISQIGGEK